MWPRAAPDPDNLCVALASGAGRQATAMPRVGSIARGRGSRRAPLDHVGDFLPGQRTPRLEKYKVGARNSKKKFKYAQGRFEVRKKYKKKIVLFCTF